nr:MAG TPA: hypothetical protein [Caudoviricetes sp.]
MLGLASGTVREYCRAVDLQKVNGQYDIDPEIVEEWRHNPPAVAALRGAAKTVGEDPLDGPPIKKHVIDWIPDVQAARKARRERLLAAIKRAGI